MIIESLTEIPSECHHHSLNVRCIAETRQYTTLLWLSTQGKSGNKAVFMMRASSHIEGGAVNSELQNNQFEIEAQEIASINPVTA